MSDYSKVIAPERRSVPTPKNMVENGKCVFLLCACMEHEAADSTFNIRIPLTTY